MDLKYLNVEQPDGYSKEAAEELLEDEHPAIAKAMTAAMAITTSGLTNFIQIPSLSLNFAFPARTGPSPAHCAHDLGRFTSPPDR